MTCSKPWITRSRRSPLRHPPSVGDLARSSAATRSPCASSAPGIRSLSDSDAGHRRDAVGDGVGHALATQRELYLAFDHHRRRLIFEVQPGAPRSPLFASTLADQTSQTAHRRRIEATGAHRAVGDRLQERLPAIEIVGFAQPSARRRQPPSFSTRRENALFFGLNRLGRRFNKGRGVPMLTAEVRPVDPYDTITQEQAADLIIRSDMNEYESPLRL